MKEKVKPNSSGEALELLIVTDNNEQWNGPIGDTIRTYFGQLMLTLPQPEPIFKLKNIELNLLSDMLKLLHNIFIVSIDKNLTKSVIEINKDLWSSPQCVIRISAPSKEAFFTEFSKDYDNCLQIFKDIEIQRTIKSNSIRLQPSIDALLKTDFNISLSIPFGYYVAIEDKNFIWLRNETKIISQGICIYSENYIDTNQFNPDYIIQLRDSVMRMHIPGPREGSYMSTSIDPVFPEFKKILLNGNFAVETRGLWETKGEYMGGPYISYTTVNSKRTRIITLEGFVYAPGGDKAPLLLKVESIIHTIQFMD
jgi:hypothetical protein